MKPNETELDGLKLVDALNRGAAEAYADPVQRAVLDEAIRQGSYVAKPVKAYSLNAVFGTPIVDGFAPSAHNEQAED